MATPAVRSEVIDGDLFEVEADAIVNAWNRNIIPWWLLLPGGVSGELKRRAGTAPFRELAKHGPMKVGDAVITGGGRIGRPIIHVAGLNMRWKATAEGVHLCTTNAVLMVSASDLGSLAMPIIGAGHGGLDPDVALAAMRDALTEFPMADAATPVIAVTIVRWLRPER